MGWGVQDQAQRDRDEKVKQALKTLTAGSAYHNTDLSGLQQLTYTLAPTNQVNQVIRAAYELIRNISSQIQACWLCLPLTCRAYIGNPAPSYWSSTQATENYAAQNQTKLIGPVVYNSQLQPTADNITCLTNSKPGNISYGSIPTQLCSKNYTTNQKTYCAPHTPGNFLLCGSTAF